MKKSSDLGILFLHALPLDGGMWCYQRDFLPETTYAPDLYGFGNCVEQWARCALEAVETERVIVVGCSVGGSCALEVAIAAQHRVEALVLVGTKAGHNLDPASHSSMVTKVRDYGVRPAWHEVWNQHFWNLENEVAAEIAKEIALRQSVDQLVCGLDAFYMRKDREHFVKECDVPIHVITGEHDLLPGLQKSTNLAALAPKGQLHVVPASGHYVPLEQPDAFNAILGKIVASHV